MLNILKLNFCKCPLIKIGTYCNHKQYSVTVVYNKFIKYIFITKPRNLSV